MKNRIVAGVFLLVALISLPINVEAEVNDTYQIESMIVTEENSIMPCADIIKWRYKTVNGVLYKRKFNYSKNEWIGNWQRC